MDSPDTTAQQPYPGGAPPAGYQGNYSFNQGPGFQGPGQCGPPQAAGWAAPPQMNYNRGPPQQQYGPGGQQPPPAFNPNYPPGQNPYQPQPGAVAGGYNAPCKLTIFFILVIVS